jgi:signal transduction histidine kinase
MKIRDYLLILTISALVGALAFSALVAYLTTKTHRDTEHFGRLSETSAGKASKQYLSAKQILTSSSFTMQAMDVFTNEFSGLFRFVENKLDEVGRQIEILRKSKNFPADLGDRMHSSFELYSKECLKVGSLALSGEKSLPDLSDYERSAENLVNSLNELDDWTKKLIQEHEADLLREMEKINASRSESYVLMASGGTIFFLIMLFLGWRTHQALLAPVSVMAKAADEAIQQKSNFTKSSFSKTPWTKAPKNEDRSRIQFGKGTPKEIETLSKRLWELVHNLEETVEIRTKQLLKRSKSLEMEIEARKKIEVDLVHAQKMEAVGQLAAGIAHEIRTPTQFTGDHLRFLKTFVDDLLQNESLEKLDMDIEFLRESLPLATESALKGIDRIAEIISSMKRFSHKSHRTEKIYSDLNQAILDSISLTRSEWKIKANLENSLEPDLPKVKCLTGELNQVFVNLIINAVHAIESKNGQEGMGTIKVSTSLLDEQNVLIEVGDDGEGMPEETAKKVFEPFFTTKEMGVGTGQGLAIAYKVVVDKHQGKIELDTQLGKGTTFRIILPVNG